jgi:hypothetical protein
MNMAMVIATAVSFIAVETAGQNTPWPLESNGIRKQIRSREAPGNAWAPGHCTKHMEYTAQ